MKQMIVAVGGSLVLFASMHSACADESRLLSKIGPSVVVLTAYDVRGVILNRGSGFVVGKDGMLAANGHIVENAFAIEARTHDGEKHFVRSLLSLDEEWGVALLSLDMRLPVLRLGADEDVVKGTEVNVVGGTVNLRNDVFKGVISGMREHGADGNLLEISNPILPVTSGGPVLSANRKVLGISMHSGPFVSDRNFAVPVAVLRRMIALADVDSPALQLGQLTDEIQGRVTASQELRERILVQCAAEDIIKTDVAIQQAIQIGAPIYNEGNHIGCYSVYEGTAYKLLYLLGERCEAASQVLGTAIVGAAKEETASRKAWMMRYGFDTILGRQTRRGNTSDSTQRGSGL